MIIGLNLGPHEVSGMEMKGHSHKMEVRLGNEIWMESKKSNHRKLAESVTGLF